MQQPLPTISHAYRLLVQEEKHQSVADSALNSGEASALMANKRSFNDTFKGSTSFRPPQTNGPYRPPHYNNSSSGGFPKKSSIFCNYCKKPGHIKAKCYKLYGYPPNNIVESKDSWKGKQIAAVAHDDQSTGAETSDLPLFTMEQYHQFLNFLD